jgi:hypothetical protein
MRLSRRGTCRVRLRELRGASVDRGPWIVVAATIATTIIVAVAVFSANG